MSTDKGVAQMAFKKRKFLVLAAVGLIAAAGCSSSSKSGSTSPTSGGSTSPTSGGSTSPTSGTSPSSGNGKTYTVGILTDLTGPAATNAFTIPKGVQAGIGRAAQEGYKIKYVTVDTGTSPTGALNGAHK